MNAFIIPIAFTLGAWALHRRFPRLNRTSRLLVAVMMGSVVLVAITEVFSLFHLLKPAPLILAWAAASGVAWLIGMQSGQPSPPSPTAPSWIPLRSDPNLVLLAIPVAIVLLIGLVAISSAPNSWDSMTYHLARVAHWVQNASVAHFPTSIPRQLHQPPFAEYVLLHLQILSGGDRWANLVQWACLIGCALVSSATAKLLGAGRSAQLFAAAFCVTAPMAILQGSSTQNDLVLAFWLACMTYFLVLFRRDPTGPRAFCVLSCVGLALLTKGTAYIYVAPFMLWFGYLLVARKPTKQLITWTTAGVALVIAVNLGTWVRNQDTFGTPLGVKQSPTEPHSFANAEITPAILLSNMSRNLALHLVVNPPLSLSQWVDSQFTAFHRVLGLSENDPRTTWTGTDFHDRRSIISEDTAANPLHLILVLAALLGVWALPRNRRAEPAVITSCVVACFILFCAYLKWQPWHSRQHVSLFVLMGPVIAVLLDAVPALATGRRLAMLTAVAVVGAAPALLINQIRPLVGPRNVLISDRTQQYFHSYQRRQLESSYLKVTARIHGTDCLNVGLLMGEDDWEYPLWVLMQTNGHQAMTLFHVVPDGSPPLPGSDKNRGAQKLPCALISTLRPAPEQLTVLSNQFRPVLKTADATLYLP